MSRDLAIVCRRHKRRKSWTATVLGRAERKIAGMKRLVRVLVWLTVVGLSAPLASANRESDVLRARGSVEIYNMDRDQAIATFRQAIAADPQDSAAQRGLASALWLSITYRRGNMTVDDYIGRVSRSTGTPEPPPKEAALAFNEAVEKALDLARKRIAANAKDVDAHYQMGAALGLRASYAATVEARTLGAFRFAREAYEEHEKVLELDASRKDAQLIVGTYRYIVSTLAMPARWVAYVAGFGGGKDLGLKMIEEAASYRGENQIDARLALVLIYNREKRYDDALKQLALVRESYPRNRLVWLESGATYLRASRAAEADGILSEGMARFANDNRPRMFGEGALWSYKRGAARAVLGRTADADQDLRNAVATEGRKWVHGRSHFELGKLAMKAGRASEAQRELQMAAALCDMDNDAATANDARRLLK
jgi:tetratricopeptide (TPR) repeat protein